MKFLNNVKTAMLMAALMMLFVFIGGRFFGQHGMIFALLLSGGMNFFGYFYSDKIALKMMRCQPADDPDNANYNSQLVSTVEELAARADLPMPRVYVCPQDAPNAFATGRDPNHAAVAVTAGIMRMLNHDELRGVLAHELTHIKNRDTLISTIAATIAGVISSIGYMLWFLPIGGDDDDNPLASLALIILAPIAAGLIQMAISRRREFMADAGGAEITGSPHGLASALQKLESASRRIPMKVSNSHENMFIVQPFNGEAAMNLFRTHPTTEDRVKALMALGY